MSKNERTKSARAAKKKPDRRIQRTRDRLGGALVALIQEKPFDTITVQDVLDRAGVGRSTFYVHYRDKDDLFVSDIEEFLEFFSNSLSTRKEKSDRVAPVKELFAHIREAKQFYDALVDAGRIHDFYDLACGHFARAIEKRMKSNPRSKPLKAEQWAAISHAHAGAMLSLLRWWIDRGMKASPQEMDETFHRMVWGGPPR